MSELKPEAVLAWIKEHGVRAAAWVYPDYRYDRGPKGMSLTPLGDGEVLFVPMRTWRFISRRVVVTPKSEPSMFSVA